MTRRLVTVVIPVYNGATYLAQAIESVLDQTYPAVEVIAVDDGSTDGSPTILGGFGDRIRIITQANAGVAAARNAGMAAARGEFVGFLDQDDSWRPQKIARQVDRFRSSASVGLVHTGVSYLDDATGAFVGPENPRARPELMVGDCYEGLLLGNPICNSSVMVRKSVLDVVGPCDLRIRGNTVQDYDLWLRVARASRFDYIDEPLTVFRLHRGQGHWDRRAMLREELNVLLRCMPEAEWKHRPEFRRRLALLHDSLAVAHMDADEPGLARDRFWNALLVEPSGRQFFRYAASCLPLGPVQYVRRSRERRRGRPTLVGTSS